VANILIVDDRPSNRDLLTTLLGYRGHRVSEATNGIEALNRVHTDSPDLIITDLLMPRMDGFEFVRNLRADGKHGNTPVIFITANYLEPEARALADTSGPHHFVTKPFEPAELFEIVDTALMSNDQIPQARHNVASAAEVRDTHLRLLQDKLVSKVEQLESLNAHLEQRVRDRTLELQAANGDLVKQIELGERANRELQESRNEQIRLRDEFLSHVSHELRSPLAVVHQFVSILFDGLGGPINTSQREYLEIALRNANQLKGMIDDLLEASRADAAKLTVKQSVIPISGVLKQTIQSLRETAATKGICVQIDVAENLPPVYADPARIGQVVSNLVDNAIKFSPLNSSITVQVRMLEDDPSFLRISVADCGCGIAPEDAERVFDRLYQGKNLPQAGRRGLGLGLYICKELVSMHGGRIWIDSARRDGCTISFTLPVYTIGSMIAPIVRQGSLIDNSFALLKIEVLPGKAWLSERNREKALSRFQHVLSRCILPDLDVLLPTQNRGRVDVFWIVARTNQKGADVMVKRFREQLSLCKDLARLGASWSVSSEILKLDTIESEFSTQRLLDGIVSSLEKVLQFED
jgi:signal transduction histidine kinase